MGYHPRIESRTMANLLTTRSQNSLLWFVNNGKLEESILGYTAKFADRYGVKLYAISIEGNHIHGPALFPRGHRSDFMRDLNSSVARSVARNVDEFPGGRLWGRRYSSEFLPGPDDVEEYFFYTVLQPVKDGLVERISDYPEYNCFHDAVWGRKRKFKVVRWGQYNADKRFKKVSIKDYTDIVYLEYARLPGYEDLSQKEYAELMHKKLEERRIEIVRARYAKGLGFAGREKLLTVRPGTKPKNTKTSDRHSHRPRVLSVCPKRRANCKSWYFTIYFQYKDASSRFRKGELSAEFPPDTYRPYCKYAAPG